MTTTDHFPKLLEVIGKIGDRDEWRDALVSDAFDIIDDLLARLVVNAPVGQPDRGADGQEREHPSIRQHETTLRDAFDDRPQIDELDRGFRVSAGIDHPTYDAYDYGIFEFLTEGTEDHPIGGNPYLAFWWGDPLPWEPTGPPASDSSPGYFLLREVNHPGISPDNWAEPHLDDATADLGELVAESGDRLIYEVLDQLNFLRRL